MSEYEIIVAREKHGNVYLDASTPEQLERSARWLLVRRFNEGWYEKPATPDDLFSSEERAVHDLTDEDLNTLPSGIRAQTERRRNTLRTRVARARAIYEDECGWWDLASVIAATPDEPAWEKLGTRMRLRSTAWALLTARSGEYEDVALERVEKP